MSDAVENSSTERKERERPVSDAVEILFLVLWDGREENGQCRTPLKTSSSSSEIAEEFGGLNAFLNSLYLVGT